MNKQIIVMLGLVLARAGTINAWQETRTPLSLFEGYMHYPLDRDRELNDYNIDAHFWTGIYFRTANYAFGNKCVDNTYCSAGNTNTIITTTNGQITVPNACCVSCEPTHRESLAALYFGQSTFTFEQAFSHAFIPAGSTINPFVILSPVTINIDYREQGVWFGLNLSVRFGCDNQWNTGVRIRAPFRDIRVSPLCGNPITNAAVSENASNLNNLYQVRQESVTVGSTVGPVENVFAARLDFLDALNRVNFNANGVAVPMVTYPATDILIAGQNASGGVARAASPTDIVPFLDVIESANGTLPTSVRWADVPTSGPTVLNGDGSGLANLQRGRVANDVSYAALAANTAAASRLYVVPNVGGPTATNPAVLLPSAQTVFTDISAAVQAFGANGNSIADFVDQVGLNACYGNTTGFGDLNFEFFCAYDWRDCGYLEGRLWIMAPTGVRTQNPLHILKFPTGNNGHPEIGLGIAGGVEWLRYLAFNFDAYYIWVTPARNNVAAPFTGAMLKNIGPCVPGKTSWHYGIIDLNVNFINPYCECMGVMVGYEAYLKGHDKLTLCESSTTDWAGNVEPLNPCVYTANTDRVANRIRTETFFNGECISTFLGFEATVSGKNIPAEVDFHIGLDIYF